MSSEAVWPREFLAEIEGDQPSGGPALWALGGPSFAYRTLATTIWIDPFFANTPGDEAAGIYRSVAVPIDASEISRADAVISTHAHMDHCHRETISPIVASTDARCVAPASSAKLMRAWGTVPEDRILEVEPGATLSVGDVAVRVYGAHDPNEPGAVSFVLEAAGVRLFVSGDTQLGPVLFEVAAENTLDYALLAFGGNWYMNAEELIEAATVLRPRTLIPFHWEFWRRQTGDLVALFDAYHRRAPAFALDLPLVGDRIALVS